MDPTLEVAFPESVFQELEVNVYLFAGSGLQLSIQRRSSLELFKSFWILCE